ncbi:hypothetical protein [Campylobacter fetus]|nr:hypothetical protein [Campylobacter fetus]ALV64629.1 hypothetical protein CFTSP3_0660 [Campylobacter fetus subsp. testudinum Sp3]
MSIGLSLMIVIMANFAIGFGVGVVSWEAYNLIKFKKEKDKKWQDQKAD